MRVIKPPPRFSSLGRGEGRLLFLVFARPFRHRSPLRRRSGRTRKTESVDDLRAPPSTIATLISQRVLRFTRFFCFSPSFFFSSLALSFLLPLSLFLYFPPRVSLSYLPFLPLLPLLRFFFFCLSSPPLPHIFPAPAHTQHLHTPRTHYTGLVCGRLLKLNYLSGVGRTPR